MKQTHSAQSNMLTTAAMTASPNSVPFPASNASANGEVSRDLRRINSKMKITLIVWQNKFESVRFYFQIKH